MSDTVGNEVVRSPAPVRIRSLEPVPSTLAGTRQELNLLWYGPSEVLLAERADGSVAGAIRLAERLDERRRHGLIADLQLDPEDRDGDTAVALIEAAEGRLKERGVAKIDAIIPDGEGLSSPFYRLGFWPSRKTVVMGWDLTRLPPLAQNVAFAVERLDEPPIEETADLVLASYQPYWQWWKEQKEDKKWLRAEFPVETEPPDSAELAEEMRERVVAVLRAIAARPDHTLFLALRDGQTVGLCDARVNRSAEEDIFDFGVLVLREVGGKQLGSLLLGHALHWLRDQGLARARVTTTSGLDDYDPTVYLYTLAYGGQVLGEYVNLVKRK